MKTPNSKPKVSPCMKQITTPLKAKNLVVRVTPQEHRQLDQLARERGQKLSEYVRSIILPSEKK